MTKEGEAPLRGGERWYKLELTYVEDFNRYR